jgi:hypothetical protein
VELGQEGQERREERVGWRCNDLYNIGTVYQLLCLRLKYRRPESFMSDTLTSELRIATALTVGRRLD